MIKYRVTQLIRHKDNDPVEVIWYTGDNLAAAMSASMQSMAQVEDETRQTAYDPEILEVRTEIVY